VVQFVVNEPCRRRLITPAANTSPRLHVCGSDGSSSDLFAELFTVARVKSPSASTSTRPNCSGTSGFDAERGNAPRILPVEEAERSVQTVHIDSHTSLRIGATNRSARSVPDTLVSRFDYGYTVQVPTVVVGGLHWVASYDDTHGRAATRVLEQTESVFDANGCPGC